MQKQEAARAEKFHEHDQPAKHSFWMQELDEYGIVYHHSTSSTELRNPR